MKAIRNVGNYLVRSLVVDFVFGLWSFGEFRLFGESIHVPVVGLFALVKTRIWLWIS